MLSEKLATEEFAKNNQKRLHKILGNFLYYDRAIYLTMLMSIKSLTAVYTKPKIVSTKQITPFLNYIATHPYAIIEYIKSSIILHI